MIDRELHPSNVGRVPSRCDVQGLLDASGVRRYHKARGFGVNLD